MSFVFWASSKKKYCGSQAGPSTARAKPGELTLGSAGPATTSHIAFEVLKRAAGFDMTFVPYPGDTPAVNALLGEHVTSVFANYSSAAEQVKARQHTPPQLHTYRRSA